MCTTTLKFSRLVGFEDLELDPSFKSESFGSRVGAKVGQPEPDSPVLEANPFKSEAFGSQVGAKVGDTEPDSPVLETNPFKSEAFGSRIGATIGGVEPEQQ